MRYHFVGIKGTGMSSLAQILFDLGNEVQGSDVTHYLFMQEPLEARGIRMLPFSADNIKEGYTIIIGNAFKDSHEEVVRAKELGLTCYRYHEMLGQLVKLFDTIAIAGCHGKTSTTALISHVFSNITGCNYLIGDGTGYANKDNKYFMIEACEYRRHFLYYFPKYSIITNVELDHVDYYKDLDDVISAYQAFGDQTSKQLVVCGDDEVARNIKFKTPVAYYGFNENNDFAITNASLRDDGSSFDVLYKGMLIGHFDLPLYGKHMVLNALAVIAICYFEGLDLKLVHDNMATFKGAKRRFKETTIGENVIIDDYAHHPTEVRVTIEAARQKYPNKEIVAILMTHTYSRTKEMYKDFAKALNIADKAYVLDIFDDREDASMYPGITSQLIIDELKNGEHIGMHEAEKLIRHENAALLFMSSKEIYHLKLDYENMLKERS